MKGARDDGGSRGISFLFTDTPNANFSMIGALIPTLSQGSVVSNGLEQTA